MSFYSFVVVLLCIGLAMESTNAATSSAYILFEIPSIPCKDPPSYDGLCSLDYKIPDLSNVANFPDLSEARKYIAIVAVLFKTQGSKACSQSGTKYFCEAANPFRCEEKYVHVDAKKLSTSCYNGRSDCSSLNAASLDSLFNCSTIANNSAFRQKIQRQVTCDVFPALKNNDPYSCQSNYKVFAGDEKHLKQAVDVIFRVHTSLKNSSIKDTECENNVADLACKVSIPACSKDRTKLVSFFSKQDCYKIVGCVNKTNDAALINGAHGMCQDLPDGKTAKQYSLDNVYDSKAANNAMALSTILFIATIVVQRFF